MTSGREGMGTDLPVSGDTRSSMQSTHRDRDNDPDSLASSSINTSEHIKLQRLIEGRVLPRLLLAYRQGLLQNGPDANSEMGSQNGRELDVRGPVGHATAATDESNASVGTFADLVIRPNAAEAIAYFEEMIASGTSVETLFRELLAPTARRLGELWEEDINSMMDVTLGLAHLQQMVRIFSPDFHDQHTPSVGNRRALLMPLPGEQHTFGITLVEEYFRRDGWHVWSGPPQTLEELAALVGSMWFDVIGFSISRSPDIPALKRTVAAVRKAARNPDVVIMVGGSPFVEDPSLVKEVGADATANDGARAVAIAAKLVQQSIAAT